MKKFLEAESIINKAIDNDLVVLFHSGDSSLDKDLSVGVSPIYGDWLQEMAQGYDEELASDIEKSAEENPVAFFSEDPSWVAMKAARSINKALSEVTIEEIEKNGQLCILLVEREDTDFKRAGKLEYGNHGKATHLFQNNIVEYDLPFGVESGDIYSTSNFNPVEITLTGKDLVKFLERNYPELNQFPKINHVSSSWYHGTDSDFEAFDDKFLGTANQSLDSKFGFCLSKRIDTANTYRGSIPKINNDKFMETFGFSIKDARVLLDKRILDFTNESGMTFDKYESLKARDKIQLERSNPDIESQVKAIRNIQSKLNPYTYESSHYNHDDWIIEEKTGRLLEVKLLSDDMKVVNFDGRAWNEVIQAKEARIAIDEGYEGIVFENIQDSGWFGGIGSDDVALVFDSKNTRILNSTEALDFEVSETISSQKINIESEPAKKWYHGTIETFTTFDTSDNIYLETKNPLGDNIGSFFSSKSSVALDFAQRGASKEDTKSWQLKYLDGPNIGSKITDEQEAIDLISEMGIDRFETIETTSKIPANKFDSIVIEAHVTLSNPMVFDTYRKFKNYLMQFDRGDIEAEGHDGVLIKDSGYDNDEWIVSFHSEQVKEINKEVIPLNAKLILPISSSAEDAFIKKTQAKLDSEFSL
jgi:hypothetical protein